MELSELLVRVTRTLEQQGVPYLVTGSIATIAYGERRLTVDIDVVVRLPVDAVKALCSAFPAEEFYVSPEAALDAVQPSARP